MPEKSHHRPTGRVQSTHGHPRRQAPARRGRRWLGGVYALITIGVLSTAVWLLWPAIGRDRAGAQQTGVVTIAADMSGFSMQRIEAKVGQPLTVRLESLDTPYHSDGGGKHQFAIEELGVSIIAPPKGTEQATFTPTKAGTYRFYCDICCGGKANPTMQGELVVTA